MDLIDAYNIALEAAGLRQISDINLDDAQTGQLATILEREKRQTLYDGYPFNMDKVDLQVNNDDVIDVSGYLRVALPVGYSVLDNKVWDPANSVFVDSDLDGVWVVTDRDWDNIPESFQEWIARRAAARFVSAVSGPDDTYQVAKLNEAQAFTFAHLSDDAQWDPHVVQDQMWSRGRGGHWGWPNSYSQYGCGW